MTVVTANDWGGFFDIHAFEQNVQKQAFELVRKISRAVTQAMFSASKDVADDVRRKFEAQVGNANDELAELNSLFCKINSEYPRVYKGLVRQLGQVSVGAEKIDPDGKVAFQVTFITNLCATVAANARGARQEIDGSNINSFVLFDSIIQLSLLEKNLLLLFEEVQELGERVVIHDALTEAPAEISDNPLLSEFAGERRA